MDDTPRSTTSSGTPRDDRFFSPREYSSRSARTSSSSENEWMTPRQENVPLYRCNSVSSEDQYFSARYSSRTSYEADQAHQQQHQAHHHSSHNYAPPRGRERQQHQQQGGGNYNNSEYGQQYNNNDRHDDRNNDRNYNNNYSVSPKKSRDDDDGYNMKNQYRNDLNYNGELYQENDPNNNNEGNYNGPITEEDVQDIFTYARRGRGEEIEKLLNRGIPVDVKDEWGNTLLIIACQNGNKRVAKNVLRRGANINSRNAKGNTPLHYCFHYGYGDTLGQYIIQKGADEGARNNMGKPCWDGI